MNRNNKILVGVLAFVVAMTIGYALFSDKITITGTAKAKGDFKMSVVCQAGIKEGLRSIALNNVTLANGKTLVNENGYDNDGCVVSGNTVNYYANLKYPGAARYFTIKITNDGSIPAALVDSTNEYEICYHNNDGEECYSDNTGNTAADSIYRRFGSYIVKNDIIAFESTDGIIMDPSDESLTEEEMKKVIDPETGAILPGASVYFLAITSFDSEFEQNTDMFEEGVKVKYNNTYIFQQPKA